MSARAADLLGWIYYVRRLTFRAIVCAAPDQRKVKPVGRIKQTRAGAADLLGWIYFVQHLTFQAIVCAAPDQSASLIRPT